MIYSEKKPIKDIVSILFRKFNKFFLRKTNNCKCRFVSKAVKRSKETFCNKTSTYRYFQDLRYGRMIFYLRIRIT